MVSLKGGTHQGKRQVSWFYTIGNRTCLILMGEWVERVANYESCISPIKAEYNINPSVSGRKKKIHSSN